MTRAKLQTPIVVELGGTGPNYTFAMPSGGDANEYYLGEHEMRGIAAHSTDNFAVTSYAGNGSPGDNDYMPAGDYLYVALGAAGSLHIDDRPSFLMVEVLGQVGHEDGPGPGPNVTKYPGFGGTTRYAMVANPNAQPGTGFTSYVGMVPGLIAYLDTLTAGDLITFKFVVGSKWGGV